MCGCKRNDRYTVLPVHKLGIASYATVYIHNIHQKSHERKGKSFKQELNVELILLNRFSQFRKLKYMMRLLGCLHFSLTVKATTAVTVPNHYRENWSIFHTEEQFPEILCRTKVRAVSQEIHNILLKRLINLEKRTWSNSVDESPTQMAAHLWKDEIGLNN